MFGREPRLPTETKQAKITLSKPNNYYELIQKSRKILKKCAKANMEYQNQLTKARFDQNRPDPKYFIDQLVLVKVLDKKSKLQEKFEGPSRIIEQKGPATFIVKLEDPDQDSNPEYTKQVTTPDLAPVYIRTI
ncbi:unnamed protein product [Didymodactylos carnosus]|nr:unnamed protein product [Didymodactylos carnosus]